MAALALFEDILPGGAAFPRALPPRPRVLFVVHGSITIGDHGLADGEGWQGEGEAAPMAGPSGATVWRWELSAGDAADDRPEAGGVRSALKLAVADVVLPEGELLMRCDTVAFPPGGCAYRHVHQGPGIRCLIEGGIRVDVHGASASYGPGGAWFEAGPDPVFAQAAADRPSRFVRVMILPRALLGASSIRYVDDADRDRPKTQQYRMLADAPIARPV